MMGLTKIIFLLISVKAVSYVYNNQFERII
jgi:hypothetical protein